MEKKKAFFEAESVREATEREEKKILGRIFRSSLCHAQIFAVFFFFFFFKGAAAAAAAAAAAREISVSCLTVREMSLAQNK